MNVVSTVDSYNIVGTIVRCHFAEFVEAC